ncbi:hypothetical protein [Labrys neptuniae]|uniref:Uncharacterized protein n=1 Tax=Labrys neptuniae TaxID=376174 RepID=A0ABV3PGI6_9HYPH
MARGAKKYSDERQGDLFSQAEQLFPVRRPAGVRGLDISLRIKSALGVAMKESEKSAAVIAAEISEMTGRDLTTDALYAYTAASKPEHEIGITRFVAFVEATGANWLIDVLAEPFGLTVMEGREAHFAQLGLMKQQHQKMSEKIKDMERLLRADPVQPSPRRRR